MKHPHIPPVLVAFLALTLAVAPFTALHASALQPEYAEGVWNNFDYSAPATYWSDAAHEFSGDRAVVDLVVAQANENGRVALPFPFQSNGNLYSSNDTDRIDPYLTAFDSENLSVILSIQPLDADVPRLIDMLLSRYHHHRSVLGINVDLEWKTTGDPQYASNAERDAWLSEIRGYGSHLLLFLTYFGGYEHFPDDAPGLVVLFDGENDLQRTILQQYTELAQHFESVGLYTGYSTSTPPTASTTRILEAAANTKYIIHTYDFASDQQIVMFHMDDIQVDWLESTTTRLIDLHLEKRIPAICGVIPVNFNDPTVGGGFLANYIKDLAENYLDVFDIAQHGYTHSDAEVLRGKSYAEQKAIIANGINALTSIGLDPAIFIPPFGVADNTTIKVVEDLEFRIFIDLYQNLTSQKLEILNTWISLTERIDNETVVKSPETIMTELDAKPLNSPVLIHYQIFDVDEPSRRRDFSNLLDALKDSGKYQFMTATQYLETVKRVDVLSQGGSTEAESPMWPLFVAVGVAGSIAVVLIVRRRRAKSNRKLATPAEGYADSALSILSIHSVMTGYLFESLFPLVTFVMRSPFGLIL